MNFVKSIKKKLQRVWNERGLFEWFFFISMIPNNNFYNLLRSNQTNKGNANKIHPVTAIFIESFILKPHSNLFSRFFLNS